MKVAINQKGYKENEVAEVAGVKKKQNFSPGQGAEWN